VPGSTSANLTDELPELSTSTKSPEPPAAARPELAAVADILGRLTGAGVTVMKWSSRQLRGECNRPMVASLCPRISTL
jgi:hypothetical protein